MKANNNKTLQIFRSWDSERLNLDNFWIFFEISKYEQLYLLFTSIKISVFMLVWKSSGCSLRKYIVLCTHIIVIKCYSFSKIEKNSKKPFIFSFYSILSIPIFYQSHTDMSWNLICFSHSIPSMFHVSRSREQAHSGVTGV